MSQWREIDEYLKAHKVHIGRPTTEQTTGGGHAEKSYHYAGTARDYGLWDSDAEAVARCLHPVAVMRHSPLAELFFAPLDIWYQDGCRVPGRSIGGHKDHCHAALVPGRHMPMGHVLHPPAKKGVTKNPHRAASVTINYPWQEIDEYLKRRNVRIGPPIKEQTTGGNHEPTSYHYKSLARDYGLWDSDAATVAKTLEPVARSHNSPIFELFFAPLNIWYKEGRPIDGSRVGGHQDHCHVALRQGKHLIFPEKAASNGHMAHGGGSGGGHGGAMPIPETVDYGSCGPAVSLLQQHLKNYGCHVAVDGQFGPKTEAAVREYQQGHGLVADGIVGPKTWQALLR
ncbi:MAG: peptidoglycan-binding domain-containing protein [Acidobacteriota bacterium]